MKFSHNFRRAASIGFAVALILAFAATTFGDSRALQTRHKRAAKKLKAARKNVRRAKTTKRVRIEVASIPTPPETVAEMLRLAELKKSDILYDLGSGDGRIPLAAAQDYGVRAVGVEIKPKLVAEANRRAAEMKLDKLARFVRADMFRLDLRGATVVTLYLSETLNMRLLPKLLGELPIGARIISHDFRMGDWQPEQAVRVPWEKNLFRTIYVWTVPPKSEHKRLIEQSRRNLREFRELYGDV